MMVVHYGTASPRTPLYPSSPSRPTVDKAISFQGTNNLMNRDIPELLNEMCRDHMS